jgi:hypothetical protein
VKDPITELQHRIVDQRWFIRFLEILPGTLSWTALILPIVLSLTSPVWVAYFIIAFDLYWTIKSFRQGANLIRGYNRLHRAERIDWNARLGWVMDPIVALEDSKLKYASYITGLGHVQDHHKNLLLLANSKMMSVLWKYWRLIRILCLTRNYCITLYFLQHIMNH